MLAFSLSRRGPVLGSEWFPRLTCTMTLRAGPTRQSKSVPLIGLLQSRLKGRQHRKVLARGGVRQQLALTLFLRQSMVLSKHVRHLGEQSEHYEDSYPYMEC